MATALDDRLRRASEEAPIPERVPEEVKERILKPKVPKPKLLEEEQVEAKVEEEEEEEPPERGRGQRPRLCLGKVL